MSKSLRTRWPWPRRRPGGPQASPSCPAPQTVLSHPWSGVPGLPYNPVTIWGKRGQNSLTYRALWGRSRHGAHNPTYTYARPPNSATSCVPSIDTHESLGTRCIHTTTASLSLSQPLPSRQVRTSFAVVIPSGSAHLQPPTSRACSTTRCPLRVQGLLSRVLQQVRVRGGVLRGAY